MEIYENKPEYNGNQNAPKKFYRSRNGKIGGVCQGLADYIQADVTIIRIIMLILLICGSLGFWIYLIFWIVAPLEPKN